MEESVIFIDSRPGNLKAAPEKYIWSLWNCYELRVEVRNRLSNCDIIFQFSLKLCIQFWKYFYVIVLGSAVSDYCKKAGCWNFWLGYLNVFKIIYGNQTKGTICARWSKILLKFPQKRPKIYLDRLGDLQRTIKLHALSHILNSNSMY